MRISPRFLLGLSCSLLVSARPAVAQEPPERAVYDTKLDAELAQPGGLKADDVVTRALEIERWSFLSHHDLRLAR